MTASGNPCPPRVNGTHVSDWEPGMDLTQPRGSENHPAVDKSMLGFDHPDHNPAICKLHAQWGGCEAYKEWLDWCHSGKPMNEPDATLEIVDGTLQATVKIVVNIPVHWEDLPDGIATHRGWDRFLPAMDSWAFPRNDPSWLGTRESTPVYADAVEFARKHAEVIRAHAVAAFMAEVACMREQDRVNA